MGKIAELRESCEYVALAVLRAAKEDKGMDCIDDVADRFEDIALDLVAQGKLEEEHVVDLPALDVKSLDKLRNTICAAYTNDVKEDKLALAKGVDGIGDPLSDEIRAECKERISSAEYVNSLCRGWSHRNSQRGRKSDKANRIRTMAIMVAKLRNHRGNGAQAQLDAQTAD